MTKAGVASGEQEVLLKQPGVSPEATGVHMQVGGVV